MNSKYSLYSSSLISFLNSTFGNSDSLGSSDEGKKTWFKKSLNCLGSEFVLKISVRSLVNPTSLEDLKAVKTEFLTFSALSLSNSATNLPMKSNKQKAEF